MPKKRKANEPVFEGITYSQAKDWALSQSDYRLALVEQASQFTLPTKLSWTMANDMSLREKELVRAARLIAQKSSLPPIWLLKPDVSTNAKDYIGPLGDTISAQDARRLIKPYTVPVIAGMLKDYLQETPDTVLREGEVVGELTRGGKGTAVVIPGHGRIRVQRIADVINSLSPLDLKGLDLQALLGVAIGVAADPSVKMKAFAQNIITASRAPGIDPRVGVDPMRVIALAQAGASRGVTFKGPADILALLVPGSEEKLKEMAAYQQAAGEQEQLAAGTPAWPGGVAPAGLEAKLATAEQQGWLGNAPLQPMGVDYAVLQGMLDALGDNEGNYIKAGKEISESIRIQREAFANSLMGKTVGAIGKGLELAYRPIQIAERILFDPKVYLATFSENEPIDETYYYEHVVNDVKDIWFGRGNAKEQLEDVYGVHIPGWLWLPMDLYASFIIAPDILLGKYLKGLKDARLTAHAIERFGSEVAMDRIIAFVDAPLARIGTYRGKSVPEVITDILVNSETKELALLTLNRNLQMTFSANGFTRQTTSLLYDLVGREVAAGRAIADIQADVRAALLLPFGARPPVGSMAERLVQLQAFADQTVVENLPYALREVSAYIPLPEFANAEAQRALGLLSDWDAWFGVQAPIEHEIPTLAGPVGRAVSAIKASAFGDAGVARSVRAAFTEAPEIRMNHLIWNLDRPGMVEDVKSTLQRSRVFSQKEIASKVMEVSRFTRPGLRQRELVFREFAKSIEDEMVLRVAKQTGFSEAQTTKIVEELNKRLTGFRAKQSFGTLSTSRLNLSPEGITAGLSAPGVPSGIKPIPLNLPQPVGLTQLANEFNIIDPVALRLGMSEAIGTWRQFRNVLYRTLKRGVPEARYAVAIKGVSVRRALDVAFDIAVRDLFLSWWKPLNVLRPAYIMRVVGAEEQARFLATAGHAEWLRSGNWIGPVTKKLTGAEGREFRILVEGKFDDITLPPLPYGHETMSEFSNQASKWGVPTDAGPLTDYMKASFSKIGAVGRDERHFTKTWAWDLTMQAAQDEGALARYLDDIARGLSPEVSIESQYIWMTTTREGKDAASRLMLGSGFATETGMRYTNEALRENITRGVALMREYTGGNAELARSALVWGGEADTFAAILEETKAFQNARPWFVHGPELEMYSSRIGPLKRARDSYANLILRAPTNAFSRQKFGKSWYDLMYRSQLEAAEVAGAKGESISAALLKSFDTEARQFAALQVNRVMFDFTRQNRLGEAMNWLFPFFQPFGEQFVVWGRILKQNPALVPYVVHLAKAGEESGFIRENERGEWEVPLTNWMAGSSFLRVMNHVPGWQLSAPLSSFNVFLQTMFPVPTGGLAGDLPIPTPGLNPLASFVFDKFLHSSIGDKVNPEFRSRLISYLEQYGEPKPTNWIPSYLRNFLTLAAPGWFEDETNRMSASFENLQVYMGQDVDPEAARESAQGLSFAKALFAMFFPTPPQIHFPQEAIEQDWQDIRATPGLSYFDAVDKFIERYGEQYRILTIAKSAVDPDSPFPVSLPPTEGVLRFLSGSGAREFMERYPEWAWAIIPTEIRDGTFDPGAYFSFLGQGLTKTLSPEERLTKAEVQQGWGAYYAAKENFTAWQEAHPSLGEGEFSYDRAKAQFDEYVAHLVANNPDWAASYDQYNRERFTPKEIATARMFAADPMFSQTQAGQGLAEWLVMFDKVNTIMKQNSIHTLGTKASESLGLDKMVRETEADLVERFPDFELALRTNLAGAWSGKQTAYEQTIADMAPKEARPLDQWTKRWDRLKNLPSMTSDAFEQLDSYNERRAWVEKAYEDFPKRQNPALLWWSSRDPLEKHDYVANLASLPYQWYTRLDRESILKDKTTPAAERIWAAYNEFYAEIRKRESTQASFSSGEAFDRLNAWVTQQAKRNPVFAEQLKHANTWAYGFFKAYPSMLAERNQARESWMRLKEATETIQAAADKYGLVGEHDFDAENKVYYVKVKAALYDYVKQMWQDNAAFKREWQELEKLNGYDRLLDAFMPEYYFRIGGS